MIFAFREARQGSLNDFSFPSIFPVVETCNKRIVSYCLSPAVQYFEHIVFKW